MRVDVNVHDVACSPKETVEALRPHEFSRVRRIGIDQIVAAVARVAARHFGVGDLEARVDETILEVAYEPPADWMALQGLRGLDIRRWAARWDVSGPCELCARSPSHGEVIMLGGRGALLGVEACEMKASEVRVAVGNDKPRVVYSIVIALGWPCRGCVPEHHRCIAFEFIRPEREPGHCGKNLAGAGIRNEFIRLGRTLDVDSEVALRRPCCCVAGVINGGDSEAVMTVMFERKQ